MSNTASINPLTQRSNEKKPVPKDIQGMLKDPRIHAELSLALPKHMTPDRLARIALTEFRKTPKLAQCEPKSFLGAVIQCAQLGLEPGNSLGHAYILPFDRRENVNGKWQTVGTDAQLIIGYRGMIDLARRSGQIMSLQAHAVYEGDHFDFAYGLDERLSHIPTSDIEKRGGLIAVYAVAKLVGGGHQIEVMWRSDVEQIQKQSKAGNNGPWKTHFEEMAKKTVIRRLFKYLPVSVEIQRATMLDENAESGAQDNRGFYGEATGDVFDGEYEQQSDAKKAESANQPEAQGEEQPGMFEGAQ
ncbi:recombination protein RecT [Marinobacter sp. 71-i]|uniref:Recombination protein RecT n=1 Tax=Marinobacter iranensis TaxID=2962607 RepID=A0ABT5Y9S6_9GAMM|nr:recombination protein RecT [Marinobacter iranensis]MDF0750334.1 recombination protein RecT [Marinobacter iranensis]